MGEKKDIPERKYPDFYENFIPIALAILAVVIVIMILYSIAVATGMLQFG